MSNRDKKYKSSMDAGNYDPEIDGKAEYDKLTNEKLEEFLLELTNTVEGKELLEDMSVKDLGNGLYQIGKGLITGRKGLEQFDKAMRIKADTFKERDIKEVTVEELHIGQKVLILDTNNYKSSYSCPYYPYEGVVTMLTDYPNIWVKADGKEFELYEPQIGIYK